MPNNPKYKQAFTGKIAVIAHFSKITLPAVKIVQKKKKKPTLSFIYVQNSSIRLDLQGHGISGNALAVSSPM